MQTRIIRNEWRLRTLKLNQKGTLKKNIIMNEMGKPHRVKADGMRYEKTAIQNKAKMKGDM